MFNHKILVYKFYFVKYKMNYKLGDKL